MENLISALKSFYTKCNRSTIQNTYVSMPKQSMFYDLYKKVPFSVELRMKGDILAMQLTLEGILSMELMTIIAFFFENCSVEKNCVWTKNKDKIRKFFMRGITQFIEYGGQVSLNFSEDSVCYIIDLMTENCVDEEVRQKMIEHFSFLEKNDWREFEKHIKKVCIADKETKHIESATCMDLPMDWTNSFFGDSRATGVIADSPGDGLVLSLNNLGVVDIEYISQITGFDYKSVISALKGSIYQNPDTWEECFYKGWETADEYLSGKVVDKLKSARKANEKYRGYFQENVEALTRVIPAKVSKEDVYITLGSPWVPADVIDEFISYIFNESNAWFGRTATIHDEITGTWRIPLKNRYSRSFASQNTYGTKRIGALYILEKTLNMKAVVVTDEVESKTAASGRKRVINKTETLLAIEKQKKLIEVFQDWVWKDLRRANRLKGIYNEKYCSNVIRRFDGGFLKFPNMNPDISLYDYQKNAVARMMFSPNTLLAHDVGAGKTFEMIAAGMEMRRIGISQKNLYVVPNSLTGQWREMFVRLYPKANVLCIEPDTYKKEVREKILMDIRDNDYDGIIIAYSCFDMITVSNEYYCQEIRDELDKVNREPDNPLVIKRRNALWEMLRKAEMKKDTVGTIFFDELGINTMFVDEAHNFKNVPVETRITNVLGVSSKGSVKCQNMMDKVRAVQRANNGRGVVFATGTPISNSLSDIFIMQTYLQRGDLALLGLENFDSWVGMFAEKNSDFEIDVDSVNFRLATRFTRFHNMPELSNLLASIADFYQVDPSDGIPDVSEYKDIIVGKTPRFEAYLEDIAARAEAVRSRMVSPSVDNMLKITTDGRKAALDMRLVDGEAGFNSKCKAMRCAENVYEIYHKMSSTLRTQLIFCDTSTPKHAFNLYDELKRLLISMGVPGKEIAFIHDATSEKKREELFDKVRNGDIRILIGSTFKMGLGVNVQDKLYALHHLDVPWRPSDMIQREGRILRKGNENSTVDIYRYIAEGSFDAYSWQILESKQKMISAILSGCMSDRMCEEIADIILNYAEVKALSVGNPLMKKRVELANSLVRVITLQRRVVEARQEIEAELSELPHRINHQKMLVEKCEKDVEFTSENICQTEDEERRELRALIYAAVLEKELAREETRVCNYRGFDVVIPANMTRERPFIYLEREGRYRIQIKLSEKGIMIRLDNFIDGLEKYLENLREVLCKLSEREEQMREELEKKESYHEEIERLKEELGKIDKELGVEK